jgi:hypothetical protein
LATCGGDLPKIADVSILENERSLREWASDGAAPTPNLRWDGTLWEQGSGDSVAARSATGALHGCSGMMASAPQTEVISEDIDFPRAWRGGQRSVAGAGSSR